MKTYNNIEVKRIVVEAKMGSVRRTCVAEALQLSIEEEKTVELVHNEKVIIIEPERVLTKILDQHPLTR